jgi:hypothetical protein
MSCSLVDEHQSFGDTYCFFFRVEERCSCFFRDVNVLLTELQDLTFQTTINKNCYELVRLGFVENMRG